jgi:hypothetical protein
MSWYPEVKGQEPKQTVKQFLEELHAAAEAMPFFEIHNGRKQSSELVKEIELHIEQNGIKPDLALAPFLKTLSEEQQADLARLIRDLEKSTRTV